ncbi:S41 family peptidase [Algoriphagus sp. D3-2-R+10]|uniref:S41 family peptidase n=1 Tax=Algoriphagus aurantiacus TaxID=3103948 RepID=UPI002B3ED6C6|nr:S41 family peptidase [Algoriphagus sp. D3-2-R+10]MEB2777343.1 S41 family peptidase [Algoriphagus sp. D3-2-R+10]
MKFNIQLASIILTFMTLIACGVKTERQIPAVEFDTISNQNEKLSIVQVFKENEHLSMNERIGLFYKLKRESPTTYDFENEDALNFYGYQLLWNNEEQDAFLIFKMIVSEFPNSSNAYDSYGEICLKMGDKNQALINYKKSLELNPDNFNAEDQIAYILDPKQKPENPAEKFSKVYETEAYREDLDQLATKITATHPNVFKFISEKNFRNLIEEKKKVITEGTTYAEFMWHCDEIIASVNCSHTSVSGFYQELEMLPVELSFPMQTRWINDQLFVIDPMNNGSKVKMKAEITSINGEPTIDVLTEIYKHLPSQGYIETTKRHLFNVWSTCFIPYAMDFPDSYTITLSGSSKPIVLNKAQEKRILPKDPSIQNCEKDLCLEFLENGKTALLTIGSFNYYKVRNSYEYFKDFIDSSFVEINSRKSKNLIIDVRNNGGGSQSASIHLLRYLVDKPFIYYSNAQFEGKKEKIEGEESVGPYKSRYDGNLYFLIDGVGNSTTGHFMSIVKVLNLGTIIGEELGSNQFCSAGGKTFRLSHTKLIYTVADNTHESMATSLPDETGILPDIYVTQSVDDYLKRIDAVKEHTFKLISKNEK